VGAEGVVLKDAEKGKGQGVETYYDVNQTGY
jgi:hypothetical protein